MSKGQDTDMKRVGTDEINMTVHVKVLNRIIIDEARSFMESHEGVSRIVV